MAPKNPNLKKEVSELMRFVAEKSKNAKQPMGIYELCGRFKEETGTSVQISNLALRINKYRGQIPEMDEYDTKTKARMMMAVKAPVDEGFLKELRKEAEVKVDKQDRIIRFEKKKTHSNQRRGSERASSSAAAKRGRDIEKDTSGERKRIRGDAGDSMTVGGHHIPQNIGEELYGPDEVDQKPVNLIHGYRFNYQPRIEYHHEENVQHAPLDPENLMEEVLENRIPEEAFTSVRDLLILLRGTLMPVESNHLNGLRRKIEGKIQKLNNGGDELVSLETINLPFEMCLYVSTKRACMNPEEESTSLRHFLYSLRSATGHLIHPSMTSFHGKLRALMDQLATQDQKVPIRIVHNAMDAILNFIDP